MLKFHQIVLSLHLPVTPDSYRNSTKNISQIKHNKAPNYLGFYLVPPKNWEVIKKDFMAMFI
jgi:hypothetical protein